MRSLPIARGPAAPELIGMSQNHDYLLATHLFQERESSPPARGVSLVSFKTDPLPKKEKSETDPEADGSSILTKQENKREKE
ncbi:hypothetical protein AVEN_55280-1 [Araneus ventricosus]|uniref:Uncharacterized protein n=1 Tax=Araneus ventricosus TaxID=182803 RepID=A0A4Y2D6U1_ARAVE|nr:hypothetical protein AVEN_55280-1 [Araneus ventricosus]